MAKQSRIEQLDGSVQALLARGDAALPPAEPGLAPLLRLAADLLGLPREDFKARLKADLERRGAMSTPAGKPIREGLHTITPYLVVREITELIDFIKQAFGAEGRILGTGSKGGFHAEFKIGDSMLMIGGGGAWRGTPMPSALHLYVEDVDAVYQRALEAGAASLQGPADQPYGDREAGVKDVAGNHWYIATHKGPHYIPEGLRSVTPYLHPRGASQLIEFLQKAFGAEEVARFSAADGTLVHAQVKIGDSIVEMGEAHGEYQPMPTGFYLSVDNVDAWYRRAIQAGGTSLSEPADQPFGARTATVADLSGNQWYIAAPIKRVPPNKPTKR